MDEVFNNVVNLYYKDIYRYAVFLSKNEDVAADITQNCFLKALKSFKKLKDIDKVKSWLIVILRNEFFDYCKKNKNIFDNIDEIAELAADDKNDLEIEELRIFILKLEEKYREPLILQIVMGLSIKEISVVLSINENTTLTNIYRAKNQLMKLYNKEENIRKTS
jgi:RNA polymerase sigma-70 factor (ECF subfamily)